MSEETTFADIIGATASVIEGAALVPSRLRPGSFVDPGRVRADQTYADTEEKYLQLVARNEAPTEPDVLVYVHGWLVRGAGIGGTAEWPTRSIKRRDVLVVGMLQFEVRRAADDLPSEAVWLELLDAVFNSFLESENEHLGLANQTVRHGGLQAAPGQVKPVMFGGRLLHMVEALLSPQWR